MNSSLSPLQQKKRFPPATLAALAATGILAAVALLLPLQPATAKSRHDKTSPTAHAQPNPSIQPQQDKITGDGTRKIYFSSATDPGIIDPAAVTNDSGQASNGSVSANTADNQTITANPAGQTGAANTPPPSQTAGTSAAASASTTPTIGKIAFNTGLPTLDPQILQQSLSSISQPLLQNLWNPPVSSGPSPYATDDFSPQLTKILTALGFGLIFAGFALRRLAKQTALSAETFALRRRLTLASTNR